MVVILGLPWSSLQGSLGILEGLEISVDTCWPYDRKLYFLRFLNNQYKLDNITIISIDPLSRNWHNNQNQQCNQHHYYDHFNLAISAIQSILQVIRCCLEKQCSFYVKNQIRFKLQLFYQRPQMSTMFYIIIEAFLITIYLFQITAWLLIQLNSQQLRLDQNSLNFHNFYISIKHSIWHAISRLTIILIPLHLVHSNNLQVLRDDLLPGQQQHKCVFMGNWRYKGPYRQVLLHLSCSTSILIRILSFAFSPLSTKTLSISIKPEQHIPNLRSLRLDFLLIIVLKNNAQYWRGS